MTSIKLSSHLDKSCRPKLECSPESWHLNSISPFVPVHPSDESLDSRRGKHDCDFSVNLRPSRVFNSKTTHQPLKYVNCWPTYFETNQNSGGHMDRHTHTHKRFSSVEFKGGNRRLEPSRALFKIRDVSWTRINDWNSFGQTLAPTPVREEWTLSKFLWRLFWKHFLHQ